MKIHHLVMGWQASLMCHKVLPFIRGEYTAVCSPCPTRMIMKAVWSCQNRKIISSVFQFHAGEINKRAFRFVRTPYPHVIGGHQRIVWNKQIILFQIRIVNNLGSFQIIFLIIGAAWGEMPLISLLGGKSGFRIQLYAVQSSKEWSIMHPPLSGDRIGHDARINCIHYRSLIGLDNTTSLCPRAFGRCSLCHTYIRCLAAKSRYTIVESVFITERDYIRSPDVRCSLTSGMWTYPLHSFLRYFRKSPADKLPFDKVLGTAHLYVSQRNIFFFGFLTVHT